MRLSIVLFLVIAAHGAVSKVQVSGRTAQQAILDFTVPDATQCTIRIFSDANRTQPIDDTNEILFPGSTACNRVGSVVSGVRVLFVAGLRTSQLATDGLMHSRSLSPSTTYSYSITDEASGGSYTGTLTTADLATGNLYAESVPYDPNGFGNAAYPSIDFTGNGRGCGNFQGGGKPCVDPVTGLQYWLMTTPGAHSSLATPASGHTIFQTPAITAGTCDTPANMVSDPGNVFANCTGAFSASLTAKSGWTVPNTWHPVYAFGVSYTDHWWEAQSNIDDFMAYIAGSASDANNGDNVLNVCLWSTATNTCLGRTLNITLPVGSPQQFAVPHATPKPYWQDWGYEPDQGYAAQPSIRIWRSGNGGTVSLSAWFSAGASDAWWNSESNPVRCENGPRSIAYDRSGKPISPALNGYFCTAPSLDDMPEVWLWIPFNADGSVRAEARWMGTISGTYNAVPSGWYGGNLYGGYPMSMGISQVVRLTYNTSKYAYCNYQDLRTFTDAANGGWYPNNGGATQPPPCFDMTTVTNSAPATTIAAWQAQHPDIPDVSQFANSPSRTVYFNNGVIAQQINSNPSPGAPVSIFGFFDANGNFEGVSDNFTNHVYQNGQWLPKMGWGHSHGQILGMPGAQYVQASVGVTPPTPDASAALNGPWLLPVLAVNRAGYGSTEAWDCKGCGGGATQTSMITDTDTYQCPNTSLVQKLCPGGRCCIEIKVNQEPCSTAPYIATNTFVNNTKNEAQAFPCTNTDNHTVVNAGWSKLQNVQPGDWLTDPNSDGNWESFIVAQKMLDNGGNVNGMWMLRESAVNAKLWSPLPAHGLTTTRHPCINWNAGCPSTGNGWNLLMREPYGQGSGNATAWEYPVNGAPPLPDSPIWSGCHHEDGPTLRVTCGSLTGAPSYQTISAGAAGFGSTIFQNTTTSVPYGPVFAGQDVANENIQSYSAVVENTQSAALIPDIYLSWRHYNSLWGGEPYQESTYCFYSAAKVSGDIYDLSGGDCYGKAPSPKFVPFVARANPMLLKEVSGPGSGSVFATTANTACYALAANECVNGSAAGHFYVNVPGARYDLSCTNLYMLPASEGGSPRPCFYSAPSVAGRVEEVRAGAAGAQDSSAARILSFVHSVPGGVAQQSYPSWDPTGHFALLSGGFLDGKRADIVAIYTPPMPPPDSTRRSSYRAIPINPPHGPGDRVRVCWGYAENAPGYDPTQGLYPMPRQEGGCSDASGAQPFLWTSEPQKYTACDTDCTLTMNLISGRVAYYYIERQNGTRTSRSPFSVMAVN